MVSEKKLAIMGLDNAGKSSILTAMKQKFDVPKAVKGLKPTLKIDRSSFRFLDHIIAQWDFGGQKKYREEYLAHKERYLSGIDLLFYVIDVQDSLRFDESLQYFHEIVSYLESIGENVPIVIFYHKVDPNLKEDPTILHNCEMLDEKFSPYYEKHQIKKFKTTIFEIDSIIRAFSKGISILYTKYEVVERFLFDIVEKMENVMALLLFEENGIELGSFFLEGITNSMKKKIYTLYQITQRRIMEKNLNTYEFRDRLDAFTKVSGVIQSFEIESRMFYILLVIEEHSDEIIADQLNFFEQSYQELYTILSSLLSEEKEENQ